MTKANVLMTLAENDATAYEAEVYHLGNPRKFPGHCSGVIDTPHGRLRVSYVAPQNVSVCKRHNLRQTWELNGKRIAKGKLVTLLNA
jgi:hypothetical protein